MRPGALLAQLAFASSANAFFPYTRIGELMLDKRVWDEGPRPLETVVVFAWVLSRELPSQPLSERAAHEAARLIAKYTGGTVPATSVLAKRENEYNVMEAAKSTKKHTQGVNQDGTDYSYFIEVGVGSEKKPMYMLIDTGAGSSWVMGTSCTSKACTMHNTFGADDSDTLKETGKSFSIAYGSGKVSGNWATDTLTVAGMDINYQFGLTHTTSDQFLSFAFDGILGLAINKGSSGNFLNALAESKEVDKNMFCVALNRAADGTNEGEISFGSPNPDKYTGEISYTSLGKENDWAIEMDDMGYNGEQAGVGGLRSFIDTGTSFMFGSPANVKKVHALIDGAESKDGTTYHVPCDSKGNMTIKFSGVDHVISPKDWVSPPDKDGKCTSNLYGFEVVKGAWLLGDTFIKNVYAVFDADERRIGFATNAITSGSDSDDSEEETTSATVTKTSNKPTQTSDDSEETGITTNSKSTATAVPDMGLGKESVSSGTATAETSQASETQDSSAPSGLLSQARFTFIFCIVPFFALLT
ncbi:putative aspartic-type endopeptidase CTSD [Fusarium culmorum]|uniref:Putative aspartic-type endopeptidase CTSD n=1 Tax=Fusarium culmorum TaxID=5516 RepID=A0A2T4GUJ3_FUSCU|nr:putative aspartic-type endopeptidase CTSD [Fusarium culmorum]